MRFSSWRHLQHKARKRTRNPSRVSPRKTSSAASSRWVDTGCRWPRRASSWPPVVVNCSSRCCKGQVWQTSGLDGCHQRVWQSPGWATVLPLHIKPSTTMQGLSSCRSPVRRGCNWCWPLTPDKYLNESEQETKRRMLCSAVEHFDDG